MLATQEYFKLTGTVLKGERRSATSNTRRGLCRIIPCCCRIIKFSRSQAVPLAGAESSPDVCRRHQFCLAACLSPFPILPPFPASPSSPPPGLYQFITNFSETVENVSGPVAILAVGAEVARSNAAGEQPVFCSKGCTYVRGAAVVCDQPWPGGGSRGGARWRAPRRGGRRRSPLRH